MPDRIVIGQPINPAKAQAAKDLRRTMTPAERTLWRELRTNRFHHLHFRRQQVIAGFIADFYCHAARLVIELDGGIHAAQAEYDAERDRVLAAHGLTILRIPNEDLRYRLSDVLARIAAACEDALASQNPRDIPHPSDPPSG